MPCAVHTYVYFIDMYTAFKSIAHSSSMQKMVNETQKANNGKGREMLCLSARYCITVVGLGVTFCACFSIDTLDIFFRLLFSMNSATAEEISWTSREDLATGYV